MRCATDQAVRNDAMKKTTAAADQIDQLLDAATQVIQFPDDKRVILAQHFQRLGQAPSPL